MMYQSETALACALDWKLALDRGPFVKADIYALHLVYV